MLKELVIKESAKAILSVALKKIKGMDFKLKSDDKAIEESLNQHIQGIKNWCNEITFKDLRSSKQTSNIYIPLDIFVYPKRIRIDKGEQIKIIPLLDIFKKEKNHLVILGQPGAGKTTSMKFFCYSIFFDEKFYPEQFNYPILVKLRDFNQKKSDSDAGILFEYLFSLFGLKIDAEQLTTKDSTIEQIKRYKQHTVIELVEKLKVLLIIDGFDELSFKTHKEIIIEEVSTLANHLENSKLVLTSRTADYTKSSENIAVYEICPLNETQIEKFAVKWLGKEKAKDFLQSINNSPYNDTSIRPLTVAHLCAIYERVGKIPDKPKTVYKKIINLLLEEWDEQRSIKRVSKYSQFEIDRKFEFLASLAYHLTLKNGKAIFSGNELASVYDNIFVDFDLKRSEAKEVVSDIESHTGLFIQAGFDLFEFAHKSLQEYLTAEYLVKLPNFPTNKRVIELLPNELAITITISSNSSLYFVELVEKVFSGQSLKPDFAQKFISRLILEKPDFNQNSLVGLAALKLYSSYIKENLNLENQLRLFNNDNLVNEFEALIHSIFRRNSKQFVKGYYEVTREFDSSNETKILLLEKKVKDQATETYEKQMHYDRIPSKLYCRESFLQ